MFIFQGTDKTAKDFEDLKVGIFLCLIYVVSFLNLELRSDKLLFKIFLNHCVNFILSNVVLKNVCKF